MASRKPTGMIPRHDDSLEAQLIGHVEARRSEVVFRWLSSLDAAALAFIVRDVGFTLYSHGLHQWKGLMDIAHELEDLARAQARARAYAPVPDDLTPEAYADVLHTRAAAPAQLSLRVEATAPRWLRVAGARRLRGYDPARGLQP